MTKDSRRKHDVRAVQAATGRRYTPAARQAATPPSRPACTLGELLTECATLPPAPVESYAASWPLEEWDYLPESFASDLLGTAVPYGSVLALAGRLAEAGRKAMLTVESLRPLDEVVLVHNGERLALSLRSERCSARCQQPHCGDGRLHPLIAYCEQHLADCHTNDLTCTAREWGWQHREMVDYDPDRAGGAREADHLVEAATAAGAGEQMIRLLLSACFDDPEIMEHLGEAELMSLRHAIDRERLRLQEVAEAKVRVIRRKTETCPACQRALPGWSVIPSYLPEYCSARCASTVPLPAAELPLPSPW